MTQNKHNIKVSIIIPVFNSGDLVFRTLDSVLEQTYDNWECLLIDDGSTDNTKVIVKNYCAHDTRFKILDRKSNNKGPSAARNTGIVEANGDYIVFLDSDDFLSESCLEKRIDYIRKYPSFDVWVFKMRIINESGKLKDICNVYPEDINNQNQYIKLFISFVFPFTVTCPIWKTSVLRELNGFNELLLRFEDPELHIRALISCYKFKINVNDKEDCFYYKDKKYKSKFNEQKMIQTIYINYYKFISICLNDSLRNFEKNEQIVILRKSLYHFLRGYFSKLKNNNLHFSKILIKLALHQILNYKIFFSLMFFNFLVYFGYSQSNVGFFWLKKKIFNLFVEK
ncbi:glycosyltransferase family 2 protein [Flavicella sp.]|uniref:glycosyltransferase family 2 protein n=1 Tax=Flavicella sp. TaxID=2957742 RepID=UPI0026137F0E|nr:glycosyltransferase family 2 protein [Flavicella sp.]MDG1804988.1 glycosyltransferase family 2 protein [Flavicella sp.]